MKTLAMFIVKYLFIPILLILTYALVMIAYPFMFILSIARKLFRRDDLYKYVRANLLGLDQVGGSLLYGTVDWTISGMTYIKHSNGVRHATYFMKFIDWLWELFTGNSGHCKRAYEKELKRHQNGGV